MRKIRATALVAMIASAVIAALVSSSGSAPTASAAPSPPRATTGSASNVTQSGATVSGTVNPTGTDTHYFFQYGPTNNYGSNTTSTDAAAGTSDVSESANLTGLSANTVYHYRIVAVSSAGRTNGADQTFTTTAASSQAVILGREGFVSPGRVVGVELGCFHGTAACTGHLTMSHGSTLIAQRDYSISADSGGFQNMKLTSTGAAMLGSNRVFHLLPVTVTATGDNGQKLSFVIHLARWVWH